MKVLIACEESQRVCIAFRRKGHEAYSCDVIPCSGGHPEWHICNDALDIINGNTDFFTCGGQIHTVNKWDLLIAHPPCTYLSVAGNRSYSLRLNSPEKVAERVKQRDKAVEFFLRFINADCDKICVENPVGYMNTHFRKADQIIHPYFFAESVDDVENYKQKRTCLWLKNLPTLVRKNELPKPPPMYIIGQGCKCEGKKIGWAEGLKAKDRSKERSKTFFGVAKAMAEQWG